VILNEQGGAKNVSWSKERLVEQRTSRGAKNVSWSKERMAQTQQTPSAQTQQTPSAQTQQTIFEQPPFQAAGWVGIDVSKDTLDAALSLPNSRAVAGTFPDDSKGFAKLLKWARRLAPGTALHWCLEATGSYSTPVAEFLVEAGQRVSVVNPYRVRHAALAQGARNKTDKADAQLLADYCRKEQPPLWRMAAPEVRELTALVRHLDNLKQLEVQQTNRLAEASVSALVAQSLQTLITQTQAQIATVGAAIKTHIAGHPGLKADAALLESIPGVGSTLAAHLLAELPDVTQFSSAQAAAAYAGLNPQEFRSGTSVHKRTRLSKRGNAHLRAALYMPAMSALRFNPSVMALAERLRTAGKAKMVILGAAMRKLLMLAFGVLKSRIPYQENYLSPRLAKT
jgi:transposase